MRSIEEEFEMGALLVKYRFPVNWLDFKRLLYIGVAGSNQVIQTSHGLLPICGIKIGEIEIQYKIFL